ncbi:hypothetical protein OPKNFCMD_1027 [Methylobacterium crusticola]|uniref:Lysine-specific metallo-endopeptidase domain-containing protein n=1 Tax=Methylobacterium crusticola TaxID=1697972 RepID=A0ABQ4QU71_9HYPH|nr:M91 family zinc metallopeptidase [Methylobacterium crusticola]GJD48310.1 hypothetical protein OPKNFCMD_1027 [Methylobacterium crusticola]
MRYWGQNIIIDGRWIINSADSKDNSSAQNPDADKFESDIQDLFRVLAANDVASVIISGFSKGGFNLTVRPLSRAAGGKAQSAPVIDSDAAETDFGAPAAAGRGTSVNIWINAQSMLVGDHQYRSKDTLFHECVHALRQMRGRWRATPMSGWDNKEEFYATMVANIYASNDGRNKDMRADHRKKFTQLTESDQSFRSKYNMEILDFRYTMSDIYDGIAKNKRGWNPLRVFESTFWNR